MQEISSVCKNVSADKIEQAIKLYDKSLEELQVPILDIFKFKTTDPKETTNRYSAGFYELLRIGISLPQLKDWNKWFCYLEERLLPTDEFTQGYIELVKSGAKDKELKFYRKAATWSLDAYGERFSLHEIITMFVETVQRDDMSQEYKLSLLRTEVYKAYYASLKAVTKDVITVSNFAKAGFILAALYGVI